MFTSYEITEALVADRQRSLRREARLTRLARRSRTERRHPRPVTGGSEAA